MVKKFHQLITEFIVLMPHAVKEIRNKSDEIAHTILIYYQVIYSKIEFKIYLFFNNFYLLYILIGRIRATK